MSDPTVSPVDITGTKHPGAGSDPSDFYGFFEAGPSIDTGSVTTVDGIDIVGQKVKAGVNLNFDVDLNRAFADLAGAFRSDADRREADGRVKFNGLNVVDEVEIVGKPTMTTWTIELNPTYTMFIMRDGTMWLDTDRDRAGDLHFAQNGQTGSWYYDRDSDGTFETLVSTSGGGLW